MRLTRAAVLLATAAIALSGCTSSSDKPNKPAAGVPPTQTASTPKPTPTPTPTPSAYATPTRGPGLTDRLLADINKPGTPARWRWEVGTTGPAARQPLGACARATLADIGATEVVQRTFFPADDSEASAAQQVAEFADAKSVNQAWSVLASWRERCATKKVDGATPKSFEMNATTLAGTAEARWYAVMWNVSGDDVRHLEYLGMVRHGSRISVIRLTSVTRAMDFMPGPDGTYPIENPLVRAAARL